MPVTLTEIKAHCRVDGADSDAVLNALIAAAVSHLDGHTGILGRAMVTQTWRQDFEAFGGRLRLPLWPVASVTSVTYRDAAGDSHGVPLPGNVIKIVDPVSGQTLPLGESGEIALKGPTLMLGYLGTPLWQTVDENGYFRTGDSGHLDAEGRLHWHGRLNDIIKTGGANVSPLEIDEALRALPEIRISQTVGVPHDSLGEVVVACVVLHEGNLLDEASVRASLRAKLASYKVPRHVLCFEESEIGMTGTSKVKSADLRRLAIMRLEGSGA
jgi:fatty-acyl-CoA synthase